MLQTKSFEDRVGSGEKWAVPRVATVIASAPPTRLRFATAEGHEPRLQARRSARVNSQTKTTNGIKFPQPENKAEMTRLLRTLRCLF